LIPLVFLVAIFIVIVWISFVGAFRRKKNKLLKNELSRIKEDIQNSISSKELKQVYLDLKVKWEEAKMIEESLRKQLEEKEEMQAKLEKEIVVLRRTL
jgi:septation ring formation regulator EzrA